MMSNAQKEKIIKIHLYIKYMLENGAPNIVECWILFCHILDE